MEALRWLEERLDHSYLPKRPLHLPRLLDRVPPPATTAGLQRDYLRINQASSRSAVGWLCYIIYAISHGA